MFLPHVFGMATFPLCSVPCSERRCGEPDTHGANNASTKRGNPETNANKDMYKAMLVSPITITFKVGAHDALDSAVEAFLEHTGSSGTLLGTSRGSVSDIPPETALGARMGRRLRER